MIIKPSDFPIGVKESQIIIIIHTKKRLKCMQMDLGMIVRVMPEESQSASKPKIFINKLSFTNNYHF